MLSKIAKLRGSLTALSAAWAEGLRLTGGCEGRWRPGRGGRTGHCTGSSLERALAGACLVGRRFPPLTRSLTACTLPRSLPLPTHPARSLAHHHLAPLLHHFKMATSSQISKKRKFIADGVFQAELGEFL